MFPWSRSDLACIKENHPELGSVFWNKFEQAYQEEHQKPDSKLMTLAIIADAIFADDNSAVLENQSNILHQHQHLVHEDRASREPLTREKLRSEPMQGVKRKIDNDNNKGQMQTHASCVLGMEGIDREERLATEKLLKKPMEASDSPKRKKRQNCFNEGEELMSSAIMSHPITPDFEYEAERGVQRMKTGKLKSGQVSDPNPLPELPEDFKQKIVGMFGEPDKATMIIEKRLFKTDLNRNNNRISMPLGQITKPSKFLKEEEIDLLDNQEEISVPLIHKPITIKGEPVKQPQIIETNILLRQWNMTKNETKKNSQYVLKATWMNVAEQNDLKVRDKVQIWAFRGPEEKLCLALVIVERANNGIDQKNQVGSP